MNRPLNELQIQTVCPTKVVLYPDLARVRHIDELLFPYGSFVVLILLKEGYGHWVCCTKRGNVVEFFDPYGYQPDNEFKRWMTTTKREALGEETNWLSRLLFYSPYEIEYNPYRLQKTGPNIATCGYWCIVRIYFKELSIEQFHALKLTDQKVVDIVNHVLNGMKKSLL